MGWSQAEGGWMVVYANDLNEAQEKFENGEFEIEEDLAQAQRNALERDFQEKWGEVDTYYLSNDELREFIDDCFELYERTGFLELFDSPYDDVGGLDGHEHNGMRFEVIRRVTTEDGFELEVLPLWFVRFENGDEAYCYPEEIAVIEHK